MWLGRSLFCGQLISHSLFAFPSSPSPTGAFVSSSGAKFSTSLLEGILLVNCQSSLFFYVFTPFFSFSVVFPLSFPIKSFFYVSLPPPFSFCAAFTAYKPTSFCNCSFLRGAVWFPFLLTDVNCLLDQMLTQLVLPGNTYSSSWKRRVYIL